MAMNMMIEGLLAAGHEVKVLAINSFKYNISHKDLPAEYVRKTGIRLVDVDLRIKPLKALLSLAANRSYHVDRFISDNFRKELIEMLAIGDFDVVQLETLFVCPYIETIRLHSKAKIFLRAHNIENRVWERVAEATKDPLKRWYIGRLARALRRYEHAILDKVDGVIAITPTDADYFRNVLSTCQNKPESDGQESAKQKFKITDIPFGVNLHDYPPLAPEAQEFPSLYTIGAMNWIPNQEGIRWFLVNVWPDIHKQYPTVKYYIAGREMPEWMKKIKQPGVVVVGEVENAREFIAAKTIMIAPIFSGSGIRVKIIEAMAAGKTIISTGTGAEGIRCTNREDILLANLPCEFFEMISICVGDEGLCTRIGQKARRLIETQYDQPVLIEKLIAFYQHRP